MNLSICILTFNNCELLKSLLYSINKSIDNKLTYEIIIVDSGSTDNTLKMLSQEFKDIITIKNQNFSGFSSGNNQAFKIAKGDYILMLNDDTIIINDSIILIFSMLINNKNIGAIGPILLNPDGSQQYSAYLSYPTIFSEFITHFIPLKIINNFYKKFSLKFNYNFYNQYGKVYSNNKKGTFVKHLMGACIMFKTKLIDEIGLMDEGYYLSLEDQDFCKRIIEKGGYKIYFLPQAKVIHYGGQSVGKIKEFNSIYLDSRLYFQKSNYGNFSKYALISLMFLISIINIPLIGFLKIFVRKKNFKKILQSEIIYNLSLIKYINKKF
jgi:GT2 family glycosyltransferase